LSNQALALRAAQFVNLHFLVEEILICFSPQGQNAESFVRDCEELRTYEPGLVGIVAPPSRDSG